VTHKLIEHGGVAWTLALVAGLVIGLSYLEFNHVEVGPMTGNTVATATRANSATIRLCAIGGFVTGVAIGIVIVEECARRNIQRVLALMLLVEAALLVAFVAWGANNSHQEMLNPSSHWELSAVVALPALAMGMQTAALRRVGGQTARTVYITGMLTRSAEEAVRYAYWRRDRNQGRAHPWRNEPSVGRIVLLVGIIAAYVAGAVLAGWLNQHWHIWTLAIPIGLLAVLAVLDAALDLTPPAR
jgi:uncharacterized membrane protein YoaK (UPF0700 family)